MASKGEDARMATVGGCPLSALWPFLTSRTYEWTEDASCFTLVNKDCKVAVERLYGVYLEEIKKKWKWVARHEEIMSDEGPLKAPRLLVSKLTCRRIYTLGGPGTSRTLLRYDYRRESGSEEMTLAAVENDLMDFKKKTRGSTSYKYEEGFCACWHQGRLYASGSFGSGGHVECYNPLTNTWSSLPHVSNCGGGLVSHEGQLLITGGVDIRHKRLTAIMTLVDNDDHTQGWKEWEYSLSMPTKSHTAVSAGGLLLIIAGMRGEEVGKSPVTSVDCLINGTWYSDKISIKRERYSPEVFVCPRHPVEAENDSRSAYQVLIFGGDIDRLRRLPDTFEGFTVLIDPTSAIEPTFQRIHNPWTANGKVVRMNTWEWFHFKHLRNSQRNQHLCKPKGSMSVFYDGTTSLDIQL